MTFRLARVLRLRTQLRERAQEEVAETRAALARVREAIGAARVRQAAARRAEEAAAVAGITGEEMRRFRAWERAERVREQALAAEAARLAHALVRRREMLVARRREERQLEILRERAAERHSAAEERATMVLLDDLARRRQAEGR
jgi:flagellar export protein FliJ